MSSPISSAAAPLLGSGTVNGESTSAHKEVIQSEVAPSALGGGESVSRLLSSRSISVDEHSEHSSADDRTNGEHTRMKYRRFRTPVNFVMFRTPTLRTEATQINTINELFFDIIFAFALGAVRQEISTTLLACDPVLQDCSFGMGMLSSFTLFFTFFWNAYLMVIFTNRFTTEEFGFNLWMYASMACTAIMAVSALDCFGKDTHCASILSTSNASDGHASFPVFASAAAFASALTGLQFTRTLHMVRARKYSALYASGCFITATVWVGAAIWAKSASAHVGLATAVCAFQLAVDILSRFPGIQLHTRLPDHAAARFRKFGVVMLTQLLMGVLAPGATYTQRSYVFAGGVLFLSVLHKMVHYDFNQGQRADGFALNPRVTEFVYVVCNLVLAYSFTALGAVTHSVLTSIGSDTDNSSAEARVRWFFCAAMGTAILCSTVIQAVLLGKGHAVRRCGKKVRTLFRVFLVLITLLLPTMLPDDFPSEKLVWILAAIVGIELIGDIVGRQQIRAAPGEDGTFEKLDVYSEAIGLGEAHKKKRQSRAAAHFQSALWRTVREGKGGAAHGPHTVVTPPPPPPGQPAAPRIKMPSSEETPDTGAGTPPVPYNSGSPTHDSDMKLGTA